MKAISIRQPWAHLIVHRDDELPNGIPQKRVENRKWATKHRGPILICAGVSREDLTLNFRGDAVKIGAPDVPGLRAEDHYYEPLDRLPFGQIVGVADLVACVDKSLQIIDLSGKKSPPGRIARLPENLRWIETHPYVAGPVCWIFRAAARFPKPIPVRGLQGVFDVPREIVAEQLHAVCWD